MRSFPPQLQEEMAERLTAAASQHGFWHGGRLCVPFTACAEAVLPGQFAQPAEPDQALEMPGGTDARLDVLLRRAAAGQESNNPDAQEGEGQRRRTRER